MNNVDQGAFNVLDALYEGMFDDAAWRAALLRMGDLVCGSAVALFSLNPSTGEVFRADVVRADPRTMAAYQHEWIHHDPRHAAALDCKVGMPQIDGMLMGVRAFHRTHVFNEFFRPMDIPYHIATWIERTPERGVVLSIQGTWKRGAFDETDRTRIALLVPHMRRIVAMKDRMAHANLAVNGILETMDRLPYGVLVLDADLKIREASLLARKALGDTAGICADKGHLGFTNPADMRAFARRLKEDPARAKLDDALSIARGVVRQPLTLLVLPLQPAQASWMRAAASWLVLVFDPEDARPIAGNSLQNLLGISGAEAALASRIAMGLSVSEAANQLSISINTARTQLKSVFAKVGVRSQAQLVQRILNSPAAFAPREPD